MTKEFIAALVTYIDAAVECPVNSDDLYASAARRTALEKLEEHVTKDPEDEPAEDLFLKQRVDLERKIRVLRDALLAARNQLLDRNGLDRDKDREVAMMINRALNYIAP